MTLRHRLAFHLVTNDYYERILPDSIPNHLLDWAFASNPIDCSPASITPAPDFVIMRVDDPNQPSTDENHVARK
jgi:hypothetical protein